MGLTKAEQETVINFSRGDQAVSVYTSDTRLINRYDSYVENEEYPGWKKVEEHRNQAGEVVSCEYRIPRKLLRLLKKERPVREYTEEQKEALRARLAEIRKRKQESMDIEEDDDDDTEEMIEEEIES
ncbi:MAG: hypothetical protein LUE86_06935 [Clostridiales bacterium]|nr:hypothetical protein [Clostridiales bacterium]